MRALTPSAITEAAREVLQEMLTRKNQPIFRGVSTPTPWHINCGLCEDFAEEVVRRVGGSVSGELSVVWLNETVLHDEYGPTKFDHELIARLGIELPGGCSEDDLFGIVSESAHAVLLLVSSEHGVLFYDAQAPEGVPSYFDLPLMQDSVGALQDPRLVELKRKGVGRGDPLFVEAANIYHRRRYKLRINQHERPPKTQNYLLAIPKYSDTLVQYINR